MYLTILCKCTLYCTLVLPYLNLYGICMGQYLQTYLNKVVKLQKCAIRIISNSHHRSHTRLLFLKHKILIVNDMYNLELGAFMFYSTNGFIPNVFHNYFVKHSDIHNYPTRHASDMNLTMHGLLS